MDYPFSQFSQRIFLKVILMKASMELTREKKYLSMTKKWLTPQRYKCMCCVLPWVRFDGGPHGDDEAAHEQVGEEGGGQHEAQHDAVQAVQLHPAHNHPLSPHSCSYSTYIVTGGCLVLAVSLG